MDQAVAFQPVQLQRASDQVVRQVKALIFGGKLGPGQRLPRERDLARQFGLSRMTIRDALRVLESQGLIQIRVGARGGAFVAAPSTQQVSESLANLLRFRRTTVRQLVEARQVVEPEVAALAAQRATSRDIKMMGQAIAHARAGQAAGDPYFIPHSVAFHMALAEAAKNPVLLSAVNSFRTLFHEALAHLLPAEDMSRRAIADHQRILEAIERRDAARARVLMSTHIAYFAECVSRTRRSGGRSGR